MIKFRIFLLIPPKNQNIWCNLFVSQIPQHTKINASKQRVLQGCIIPYQKFFEINFGLQWYCQGLLFISSWSNVASLEARTFWFKRFFLAITDWDFILIFALSVKLKISLDCNGYYYNSLKNIPALIQLRSVFLGMGTQ